MRRNLKDTPAGGIPEEAQGEAAEERAAGDVADDEDGDVSHLELRHAQEPDGWSGRISYEIF